MATQVQNRRGTTAEHATFTGAVGEVTVDTTKDTVVVHDGSTAGGAPLLREDQSNLPTSAPTTGLYNNSGALAISTNGQGRLFVDSSGNIGIGVANASNALEINNSDPTIRLTETSGGYAILSGNTGNVYIGADAGDTVATSNITFAVDGTSRLQITSTGQLSYVGGASLLAPAVAFNGSAPSNSLVINSSGQVGLGTSSPGNTLHVNSGNIGLGKYSDQSAATRFIGITGTTGFEDVFAAGLGITTTVANESQDVFLQSHNYGVGYSKLILKANGNVGVGTASPSVKLEASDSSDLEIKGRSEAGSVRFGMNVVNGTYNWIQSDRTTSALQFAVGNTERARIDSSGTFRVKGAGTAGVNDAVQLNGSAPANSLLLDASGRLLVGTSSWSADDVFVVEANAVSGNNYALMALARGGLPGSSSSSLGFIRFTDNSGNVGAEITASADGAWTSGSNHLSRLVFSTTADGSSSPTEQLRITSDRYVRLASGSGGIQFNGDAAAANALDDYEEGTFTPTIRGTVTAGTGTYTTQLGKYTKVGNLVTVTVQLSWSAHTGSGSINVQPLPFAASTVTSTCAVYPINISYNDYIAGRVLAGQSVMYPYSFGSGSSISLVNLVSAGTLDFTATYYTS